jgi:diguanylate cyclase (GGDEF)-like protein/PAS domain S-box-containing protein
MASNKLPDFANLEGESDLAERLKVGAAATESIDLSSVFGEGLTTSGSFNAEGIKRTSFCKLLRAIPIPALLVDKSHTITFCNDACGRISRNYEKLEGSDFSSIFPSPAKAGIGHSLIEEVFENRKAKVSELEVHFDRSRWVRVYLRPIRLAEQRSILILVEDLTLEKRQLLLLNTIARAKKEWEQTFDTVPDLIALIDSQYKIARLNKALAEKTGVTVQEAVGQPCYRLIHGTDAPPAFCPHSKMMADGRKHTVEYHEETLGGFYVESIFPSHDGLGLATGCVLVARDVTEQRRLQEELERQAQYDPLTKLFNRGQVLQLLDAALKAAKRYGLVLSLSICDIDDLKKINDEFGHRAGDLVLKQLGEIVGKEVRQADIAGRYGGDELLLVFPHTDMRGAYESMERIRRGLEETTFQIGSKYFRATCTSGVAEFTPTLTRTDDLIHVADMALLKGKQQGRNRIILHQLTTES